MRRILAILLLGVLLFNTVGYTLVFEYFFHQTDQEMVREFRDPKTNTRLIEFKVPVHMPNLTPWAEYEHIQGQVQLKEHCYNYVRLKMTRDTMYMIGLPNDAKTKLLTENIILAKQISDAPLSKKSHDGTSKKSSDVQYHALTVKFKFVAQYFVRKNYDNARSGLLNPCIETRGQPPNSSC